MNLSLILMPINSVMHRPRGLMDKASDFGSEDCEFESRRGRVPQTFLILKMDFFSLTGIKTTSY